MNLAITPNIQKKCWALEGIEFRMWWASVLWPSQSITNNHLNLNNQCSSSAIIIRKLKKKLKVITYRLWRLNNRRGCTVRSEVEMSTLAWCPTSLGVDDEGLGFGSFPIGEFETWGRNLKCRGSRGRRKKNGNPGGIPWQSSGWTQHFPCWGHRFNPWSGN